MTDDKHTWPCPGRPEDRKGQLLGMYHCEYCGEMQLAGVKHCLPQNPENWEEPFPKLEFPSINTLLADLHYAGQNRDTTNVRAHLEEVLRFSVEDQRGVWDALHAHREDDDAKFILDHLNIDRDDNDNWIVSVKGEF